MTGAAGPALLLLRIALGLDPDVLARTLGMSAQRLGAIESGADEPDRDVTVALMAGMLRAAGTPWLAPLPIGLLTAPDLVAAQPAPVSRPGAPSMHDVAAHLHRLRRDHGLSVYGTLLQAVNGRDAGVDELQEQLDALVYRVQAVLEQRALRLALAEFRAALVERRDVMGWEMDSVVEEFDAAVSPAALAERTDVLAAELMARIPAGVASPEEVVAVAAPRDRWVGASAGDNVTPGGVALEQLDAARRVHVPRPGMFPPACMRCSTYEPDPGEWFPTPWPCDTAAALGARTDAPFTDPWGATS